MSGHNLMTLSCIMALAALIGSVSCATVTRQTSVGELEVHTIRMDYANVYLVKQGANAFLVDAGHEHNAEKLEEKIQDAGVDPAKLRAIIITHGHADHAGGAAYFKKKFDTPIIAGAGDKPLLRGGTMGHLCPTDRTARRRHSDAEASSYTPVTATTWVGGEPLSLAEHVGIEGQIIPVPGHTEGSIWVQIGASGFMGDLFRGELVGRDATVHFYMCDLEDNRQDIQGVVDDFPAITTYFTGHFGPVKRASVVDMLEDWE